LNPLLKLDGYYLLMDWLETPMLHERALRFVQEDLWQKLVRREPLARQERDFGIFGLLSLAYTVVVVLALTRLLGSVVLQFLQDLVGPRLGLAATVVVAAGLAAVLLWPYLERIVIGKGRWSAPA
jgi:putative peptide zinc metalloprotease protein